MLALQWFMSGAKGIPYLDSLYEGYMSTRDFMAEYAPEMWAKTESSPFWQDPKAWFLDAAGDKNLFGYASSMMGMGLTSRISAPTAQSMVTAPGGPTREVLKQAWSAAKMTMNPEDPTARAQSVLNSLPSGLQGLYETAAGNEGLTYTKQGDMYGAYKLSDVEGKQVEYWRTPAEQEMRKYGLKSYKEMASREIQYDTQKLTQQQEAVQGKLVEQATREAMKGNMKRFDELNNLYADLTGKPLPINSVLQKGMGKGLSQEERILKRSLHTPSRLVKAAQMEARLNQLQEGQ